jgi:hypothetical protein
VRVSFSCRLHESILSNYVCKASRPPQPQATVEVVLHEPGEISLVAVSKKEPELSRLWNSLLDAHHPLGSGTLCATQRRSLIRSEEHGWLGGLLWAPVIECDCYWLKDKSIINPCELIAIWY